MSDNVSNAIKIQINSKEALERLLGGSDEVQIQVRDNIANDFIRNHIQPLMGDYRYNNFVVDVSKRIEAAKAQIIEQTLGKPKKDSWGNQTWAIPDELKKIIQDQVKIQMTAELSVQMKEHREELQKKTTVLLSNENKKLSEFIGATVRAMIKEEIAKSLKEVTSHMSEMAAFYKSEAEGKKKDGERNIALQL